MNTTRVFIIIEQELYLNELGYIAPSRLYIELLYLLFWFRCIPSALN